MTNFALMQLLFGKSSRCTIQGADGQYYTGVLQSIQKEDGSGYCFNITMRNEGKVFTFFLRTIG